MKTPFFFTIPLLVLTGCSVLRPIRDQSVHHLLNPLVPDRSLTNSSPAIAVNRPSLPSYLDRSQLVTRSGGELMMSPLDLWAEPLDAGLARVTASNLSRLTGSMNIQPVKDFTTLDYTALLELKIARFDPEDSNQMLLQGTWKLQPVSGQTTGTHFFRIALPIPSSPSPMSARVTAMNQALEQLARQIAGRQ